MRNQRTVAWQAPHHLWNQLFAMLLTAAPCVVLLVCSMYVLLVTPSLVASLPIFFGCNPPQLVDLGGSQSDLVACMSLSCSSALPTPVSPLGVYHFLSHWLSPTFPAPLLCSSCSICIAHPEARISHSCGQIFVFITSSLLRKVPPVAWSACLSLFPTLLISRL